MTPQPITDAQIRAAFIARSEGSPSHDLAERISAATRRVRQQPRLVVLPGGLSIQPERLLWAAAISATSLALVGGLLLAGRQPDDQAVVPPIETPTAPPSVAPPSESPSESPAPPESPEPTPAVEPTPDPSTPPAVNPQFAIDDGVVTLVGDLRVRSAPTVAESSARLEPLLPSGARLLVVGEPVAADGYLWYHTIPFESGYPSGWVAAGSREGESWIAADQTPCPAAQLDSGSFGSLGVYGGLACFGNQEIEVTGEVSCGAADVDYTISGPTWLAAEYLCSFVLDDSQVYFNLDGIDVDLPLDQSQAVTGHFADPQSSTCVWAVDLPAPDPSEVTASCRAMFVATEWQAVPID